MRWAETRFAVNAGAMLLLVVWGQEQATANGSGTVARPALVPAIPVGEESPENSLPLFDWRDDECEPVRTVPEVYEQATYEQGIPETHRCHQGTDGCTCSCHRCRNTSRFYVAGVVGASFATLTAAGAPSSNDPLFTSGGIAGMSFQMLDRAWRVEMEGRARNPISDTTILADGVSTSSLTGSGGWSAMVNLWRDYDVTERLTAYAGGGIGGGGYQFSVNEQYPVQDVTVTGANTVGGFAWQVGGGLAFALTDRITLDLGYRFFELASGTATAQATQGGLPLPDGTATFNAGFSASELFFALRIYDPFRRWR
ncbi:MAG: outer membrane protein [Planctomycetia bacterium]